LSPFPPLLPPHPPRWRDLKSFLYGAPASDQRGLLLPSLFHTTPAQKGIFEPALPLWKVPALLELHAFFRNPTLTHIMTMTIDPNQQRFGSLNLDHMSSYSNHPQFTNPWVSSSQAPSQSASQAMYVASHNTNPAPGGLPHLNLNGLSKHPQHASRAGPAGNASLAPYGAMPVTTAPAGSPHMADIYGQQNLPSMTQDPSSINRLQHPTSSAAYGDPSYTTSASPVGGSYAPSPTPYDQLGYAPAPMRGGFALAPDPEQARRYSQQLVTPRPSSYDTSLCRIGDPPPRDLPLVPPKTMRDSIRKSSCL